MLRINRETKNSLPAMVSMPVTPALGRLRQELEVEAILGYRVPPCHKSESAQLPAVSKAERMWLGVRALDYGEETDPGSISSTAKKTDFQFQDPSIPFTAARWSSQH